MQNVCVVFLSNQQCHRSGLAVIFSFNIFDSDTSPKCFVTSRVYDQNGFYQMPYSIEMLFVVYFRKLDHLFYDLQVAKHFGVDISQSKCNNVYMPPLFPNPRYRFNNWGYFVCKSVGWLTLSMFLAWPGCSAFALLVTDLTVYGGTSIVFMSGKSLWNNTIIIPVL